jgi:Nif-specific regulatory protein
VSASESNLLAELQQVTRERDLYRRLLGLGSCEEVGPFLEETLRLMVEVAGAHQGYLELSRDDEPATWWTAHGFSATEIDDVREAMSSGIIAEAIQTGQTIVTDSALSDRRYEARASVRQGAIQAVLCAPIGSPPLGFLYLQRRLEPGAFAEEDRRRVEAFAEHVAPFADRLIERSRKASALDETRAPREQLRLNGIVGRSRALAAVLNEVLLAAPLEVDVLLTGDSGTGKSQLARAIHDNSPRAGRPFVELNCAAIPETLIESELFGALPGAHSTASRRIDGKVAAAERGTLFLDEIGELSPAAQAKLLQLLQARAYYPLGATKVCHADVRVIAATNMDLESAVADGRFRQDLFYRLDVVSIRMPTLAERREDIPELARHFCAEACARHRLPQLTLSVELLRALEAAEWPGNLRQLAHTIEAAAIRCAGSGAMQVERKHVFRGPSSTNARGGAADADKLTFQEATRRFQADLLRRTFEETNWNVLETSRRLELTRSHVYNLIKAFGIDRRGPGESE